MDQGRRKERIDRGIKALGGDDRAIRLNNTNNGVETRVAVFAARSTDGWIEFREDNNTGTPTPGIGLTIGTVDGVSGVINTSNTGDNNRERITINVQQGDLMIAELESDRAYGLAREEGLRSRKVHRAVEDEGIGVVAVVGHRELLSGRQRESLVRVAGEELVAARV